ncbi:hypothetical protein Tco_0348180 [Tanacetum coccineum]
MSESCLLIHTQLNIHLSNPNPLLHLHLLQDDTSDSFLPEPTQPILHSRKLAFSATVFSQIIPTFTQPAAHFKQTNLLRLNKSLTMINMRYGAMRWRKDTRNSDHNLWRIGSAKEQSEVGKSFYLIDHMPDFHHYDDARDIWIAVKARFGGNEESKKMRKTMLKQQFTEFSVTEEEGLHKGYDRFQKILSQLNQVQARPDNDDINLKFLRALSIFCPFFFIFSWSQVALALKTRGGLESMSFDDLYNKLRSLELDVRIGHSYGVKAAAAPTHSAFIGAASSRSKSTYSDQQNNVSSVSQTSSRSDNIMECVDVGDGRLNLRGKWAIALRKDYRFEKKAVDDKARYSAFKVTEVKTDEPKALVSVDSWLEPTCIAKTLEDPDWVDAMQEEMQQFINQQVVAQGTRKEEGIDFDELDVKSAFLYGEIDDVVYVTQTKRLKIPYFQSMYTEWLKSVYGTSSSTRSLVGKMSAFLVQHNYREVLMKGEFEMSAMGEMTFFLGLQVKQLPDGIFISQDKYVKDMLTKFDMESINDCQENFKYHKGATYNSACGTLKILLSVRSLTVDSDYAGFLVTGENPYRGMFSNFRQTVNFMASGQKEATIVATSSTEAEYVAAASCCAQVVNTAAVGVKTFSATRLVLLLSFLLDALFLLVAMDYAAGSVYMLVGILLLVDSFLLIGFVYAANTSIHAAGLGCAGSIMFLLADLFLLVVTCFCCAQFDIADWLASATSHLVSAGSLHSCWCNNVSAA